MKDKNIIWVIEDAQWGEDNWDASTGYASQDKESLNEKLGQLRKDYVDMKFRIKKYISI